RLNTGIRRESHGKRLTRVYDSQSNGVIGKIKGSVSVENISYSQFKSQLSIGVRQLFTSINCSPVQQRIQHGKDSIIHGVRNKRSKNRSGEKSIGYGFSIISSVPLFPTISHFCMIVIGG